MFTSAFPIISTNDLPRALAFYRDLLGGKITYQFPPSGEPGYVALDLGPSHLGIGQNPDTRTGPQRIAIWLYTDDTDAAVALLRAACTVIIGSPAPPDTDPARAG